MKILVFGDIYGRIGRKALQKELPILKNKYKPDFIIASVDNITSGRGAIKKHILEMESLGIDIMSSGDHAFDNLNKIEEYLNDEKSKLIRPANFYNSEHFNLPGVGYKVFKKEGKKLLFIHLLGEVFMKHKVINPFLLLEKILEDHKGENFDGIVVDFHKEVTSEGHGMGFLFDGKVSAIYGAHTHVQTNDETILPNGTAFISDIGTVCSFPSIIGASIESAKKIFLTGMYRGVLKQSLNNTYVLNGIFLEIGNNTKAEKIEKIRISGEL